MKLERQILEHAATVQAVSYSMSVGELMAMYRDKELNLHPEFQRFFRWTPEQKSRFIESLLLGIPVPAVFVAERPDSKWDVIDGLQRLSTILELVGELRDEDDKLCPPLELTRTHYLPDLEGRGWLKKSTKHKLPSSVQIALKRARIDVNIVKSTSDVEVKYEIFQRLNTGGSKATEQEVRNCLLIMANRDYFLWVKSLAESENFRGTLALTDRALEEAFDMELVVRFLVLAQMESDKLRKIDELGAFLSYQAVAQAKDKDFDQKAVEKAFEECFEFLNGALHENSFRRYDVKGDRYMGPMLASIYEVVAVGLGNSLLNGGDLPKQAAFEKKHRLLWEEVGSKPFVGSGIRASTRIPETIMFGRQWIQE